MNRRPCPVELVTGPYPSFPTDLQSVMLGVASLADGSSRITETIFEERFATAKELQKLGAHIIIEDRTACVAGRKCLKGGCVRASDLRGGAALVVAGLAAEGVTEIAGYGYIRRGYEDICRDLQNVGARSPFGGRKPEAGQVLKWLRERTARSGKGSSKDLFQSGPFLRWSPDRAPGMLRPQQTEQVTIWMRDDDGWKIHIESVR